VKEDYSPGVIYGQRASNKSPNFMAKYGPTVKDDVGKTLHKAKRGELKSGRSGKKVKSRKQAIAIGLSEARKKGKKVPSKR
jgi:hypothetical protein